MDLKKYDELRNKIKTKDFEGNNKGLDKWLFMFSWIGNFGSIFFAYFLLFPALYKAISINVISGFFATLLGFVFTLLFLTIFEIIKRYLLKSFSHNYVSNSKRFKLNIVGWLIISIVIIGLSFYLSIIGSKNLASTKEYKNDIVEQQTTNIVDSLLLVYENEKKIYLLDNKDLREINNELRRKLTETPLNYRTVRNDYQKSIDKNDEIIKINEQNIKNIDKKLNDRISNIEKNLNNKKFEIKQEDVKIIFLFIIIAIFCEIIIFGGIYFREYYEYNLYLLHNDKFEKIYQKKDRYRALLAYIYDKGKLNIGDKVISGLELKDIVTEKTTIQNSKKFVDEFFFDMDRLGIFSTKGKRRYVSKNYDDAIIIIDNFDDSARILENII